MKLLFLFGLFGGIWGNLAFAQKTGSTPSLPVELESLDASSDALISSREAVEIVEDSTLDEALSRRPDLQFENVTIDGEKAQIDLSEISSDAVSGMELLRAVTPDMDADSRGGSLRLNTSPSFDLENRVIKADFEMMYTDKEDAWEQELKATYGNSFGLAGIRVTGKMKNVLHLNEHHSTDWYFDQTSSSYLPSYFTRFYFQHDHEETSVNGNFDYKISDRAYIYLRANYETFEHEAYMPRLTYRFHRSDHFQAEETGSVVTHRDLVFWNSYEDEYGIQSGWIYTAEEIDIDLRLNYEQSDYAEPDFRIVQYRSEREFSIPSDFVSVNDLAILDQTGANDYRLVEATQGRLDREFSDFVLSANAKYRFEIAPGPAFLKFGIKQREQEQVQDLSERAYTAFSELFYLRDVAQTFDRPLLIESNKGYGPFPETTLFSSFMDEKLDSFLYDEKRSRQRADPRNYTVNETISSAYAMLNFEWKRVRMIAGGRFEKTQIDFEANEVVIDSNGNYDSTIENRGDNSYTNFFPGVHLRYFLGSKATLIGSWTGTIYRPHYESVVPFRTIDHTEKYIEEGNPNLGPTEYDNFDFSIDFNLFEDTMLSVEVFSKDVKDVIYRNTSVLEEGEFAGYTFSSSRNGISAEESGVKFILNQNLGFLGDAFEKLTLRWKYTLQNSETQYPQRQGVVLPVTGRPEEVFESTISFSSNKVYAQLQYSHTSKQLVSVDSEPWRDRYASVSDYMSFNGSYQLTDSLRVFVELLNFTQSVDEEFLADESLQSVVRWSPIRVKFGMKFNF